MTEEGKKEEEKGESPGKELIDEKTIEAATILQRSNVPYVLLTPNNKTDGYKITSFTSDVEILKKLLEQTIYLLERSSAYEMESVSIRFDN